MDEARVRRALTLGPVVAAAGIAWVAVVGARGDATTLPSLVVLAGIGLAIWGTHHFGRLGPDGAEVAPAGAEPEAEPAARPKKKRKKAAPPTDEGDPGGPTSGP